MSKTPVVFFEAASVMVGTCKNPMCRGVHISPVDGDDLPHAQAVLLCEQIEDFIADLRVTRDRIIMGGDAKGIQ